MAGFTDRLAPNLTTVAICWRIARRDGVVLGFTSHDLPLDIGGLRYEAAPGMTPSAISLSDGLEVATMEFAGALTADTITESDLAAGCFDGAGLSVFMADWTALDAGTLHLASGTLGDIERQLTSGGGGFTATVRGPTAAFEAIAVEICSPDCRAELGDQRCRVDLAPLTSLAYVATGSTRDRIVLVNPGDATRFVGGKIRPLEGPSAGIDARISVNDGSGLILFEGLPFAPSSGDRVIIRQGCDKRLVTCATRFGNAANFRGEPHVPGGDLLTRFPGV